MKKIIYFMGLAAISFSLTYMFAWLPERKLHINTLMASDNFVTIPVEERGGGEHFLLIYNLSDKSLTKVISKKFRVNGAKPSLKDPHKVYITSHNKKIELELQTSTLWKCDVKQKTCESIFTENGIFFPPVELKNDELLFIKSPPSYRKNLKNPKENRIQFVEKDFYTYSQELGVKKITNYSVYDLNFLNVIKDKIIFNAYGPSKKLGGNVGHTKFYNPDGVSQIYNLNINISKDGVGIEGDLTTPFLKFGSRIDVQPSAISNPPLVAFKSADSGISVPGKKKSGWAYEIIVYNYETKKILHQIHPARRDLSNPALTPPGMLYYTDSDSDGLDLYAFNIKSGAKKRLLSKKWNRLSSQAKAIQLD